MSARESLACLSQFQNRWSFVSLTTLLSPKQNEKSKVLQDAYVYCVAALVTHCYQTEFYYVYGHLFFHYGNHVMCGGIPS